MFLRAFPLELNIYEIFNGDLKDSKDNRKATAKT